jgi:hypothetical protein
MKVLELKGYKSLRALNAFHALMLGMKMLPAHISESYEAFYKRFGGLSDNEKETMIREAALFVELSQDEIEALASFCADANGIPFNKNNISNLKPDQMIDIIVSVCMEIGKIKIDMVSEDEKKK